MRRPLGLSAALLVVACGGGGSATAPSGAAAALPAGTVLTVVSGEDDRPVAGAAVTVAAQTLTTSATGQVTLAAGAPARSAVEISASAFLLRQTVVRAAGETRFTLWPDRPGFDAGFTREMFYGSFSDSGRMIRPTTPVTVVMSAELREPAALDAARAGAALLTAANGGAVPYAVADAPAAGAVRIDLVVDPADPGLATSADRVGFTVVQIVGDRVTGGRIVFRDLGSARLRHLVAHELGHTFGAGHPTQPGLMNAVIPPLSDYSDAEKLAFRLATQRRPGNAFPDDDRAVSASAAHI